MGYLIKETRNSNESNMAAESASNEITKCNYEVGLKELMELIKIADFVAIDCTVETTGFLLQDETFNAAYMSDAHEWTGSWYDTIKSNERSRCLLEVGVAVFKRVPSHPMDLEVQVFNIPVLPACIDDNEIARFRGRTSARLRFDGYGQEFIKNVEFDVNKVFYMATPYLNRQLQEQADIYMTENPNFMVATRKRRLNPYLMPQLFEEVSEKERKSIIDRLKGVSNVFEALSQRGIPVIGHHLLLKLIFIYKDFVEYLPDTYPEYVDKVSELFNVIYDTKQMAHVLKNFPTLVPAHILEGLNDGLKLYQLIRNLNASDARADGFLLYVGSRSELYVEDLLDLLEGDTVEEESNSFCYVAGFDALACGMLFLDLVTIMEHAKLDCSHGQEGTNVVAHKDYLEMFLKGDANHFKNKIYQAPEIPNRQSTLFLEQMQVKKHQFRCKMEDEEKGKQAKARKGIAETYNFTDKPLKRAY